MLSDVRKRCLPSRAAAGWSHSGGRTRFDGPRNRLEPHENRLEPPWRSERPRCGVLLANRQPVHWTGRRLLRRSQELQSRAVIDRMVVNRANTRRTPTMRLILGAMDAAAWQAINASYVRPRSRTLERPGYRDRTVNSGSQRVSRTLLTARTARARRVIQPRLHCAQRDRQQLQGAGCLASGVRCQVPHRAGGGAVRATLFVFIEVSHHGLTLPAGVNV
jgi:hypothetical protein